MEYKDYSIQIVAKQDNLAVPKNVNFPKRKDKSFDLSFLSFVSEKELGENRAYFLI